MEFFIFELYNTNNNNYTRLIKHTSLFPSIELFSQHPYGNLFQRLFFIIILGLAINTLELKEIALCNNSLNVYIRLKLQKRLVVLKFPRMYLCFPSTSFFFLFKTLCLLVFLLLSVKTIEAPIHQSVTLSSVK